MKKIGLFYATKAERTSWVAEKIQKEFGEDKIEVVAIEQAWQNDFAAYDCFIVGASTWFDGELPTYWDELLPELRTMELKGKKVAIFGLGDQELAAMIGGEMFRYLDGPVERVGSTFTPVGFNPILEKEILPDEAKIYEAAKNLLEY